MDQGFQAAITISKAIEKMTMTSEATSCWRRHSNSNYHFKVPFDLDCIRIRAKTYSRIRVPIFIHR